MTERQPSTPPPEPDGQPWDSDQIAVALGTAAEPRVDRLLGHGVHYHLEQPPGTELELFERARIVRLNGPDFQLTLTTAPNEGPQPTAGGVIFERPAGHFLCLSPAGVIFIADSERPQGPLTAQEAPFAAERPIITPSQDEEALLDDSAAPQDASQRLLPKPDPGPETAKGERMTLAGRLGREPIFRTTRNQVLVAKLVLAHRLDDGEVRWCDLYAFRDRAERVRAANLRTGMFIEAITYRHERTQTTKSGEERRIEEYYVVALKPR